MQYLFRPAELKSGVRPTTSGLDLLSCQRLELDAQAGPLCVETGPEEVVLISIQSWVDYQYGGTAGRLEFQDTLYLPRVSQALLWTGGKAIVMRIGAPSDRDTRFAHIRFEEVALDPARHKVLGSMAAHTYRDVYMCIDDRFNASRLLVGIGKGGTASWTVWPPHEHGDEKEKLYVYFNMGSSFGIQCLYESLDEPLLCGIVREGDMVTVPRGFHPNVGCPSGRIAYIYAMAARVQGERQFTDLRFQEEYGNRL